MTPPTALPLMESAPDAETRIDGRTYLYFGGTSYLGLAARAEVIEAGFAALRAYGIHSATSRAGFGATAPLIAVESLSAEFFASEDAFYFASGYVGNHILVQALAERCDIALADESAHFCLHEAAKLLGKPIVPFRHCDAEDLARKVRESAAVGRRPLVLTDGVFALDGTLAPLDDYVRVLGACETATLLIDDAHGFGTIGSHGRGALEQRGLWSAAVNDAVANAGVGIYVCGTLSKALGGYGGILPGSRALLDRVRATSHYFDGASAPMSAAAGATAKALEIVRREPELRERLGRNAAYLRAGLRGAGLDVADSPAPIIGLRIGDGTNMRRIQEQLRAAGILIRYAAAYSGSGKEGCLRIAVFATHTEAMLDRLLAELRRVI